MGTRTSVFLTSALPLLGDAELVLTRLRRTEAECRKLTAYWRSAGSAGPDAAEWSLWEALDNCDRYRGPGSLGLVVTTRAIQIRAAGRWRGFLSIPRLRTAHLAAFRSIAAAIGSGLMAITHDSTEVVNETFWDGATLDDCVACLEAELGPAQPSVDAVDPSVSKATEHGVPNVWYLERLPMLGPSPG
jgi:hypothetical protein